MTMPARLLQRLQAALPLECPAWDGSGLQAGVLVALTDETEPRVLLGRRALHLPLHPGEVAFPGGKRESADRGPWDTALREAEEEVCCLPDRVRRVGELAPLVTRSGFTIHPCVAVIPADLPLRADPSEVAEPHFRLHRDTVWGTTARVLLSLVNLGLQAELDPLTFTEEDA